MNRTELIAALQLPPNTNQRNIVARTLKQHAVGGEALVNAKEAMSTIANNARTALHDPHRAAYRAENQARKDVAELALSRLADIEAGMLAGIEQAHNLPSGSLVAFMKDRAPGE